MTVPARAARLWLALAVVTLGMGRVGSDVAVGPPPECIDLPALRPLLGLPAVGQPRRTRLLRLGWLWVLGCPITARPAPRPGRRVPEPEPDSPRGVGCYPSQHTLRSVSRDKNLPPKALGGELPLQGEVF